MASVNVPATRIRLAQHLCGVNAGFVLRQSVPRWDTVPVEQYVPNINFGEPNNQTELVSGFGRSLFFDFAGGTRFAGGIRVRMAKSPYNFGEVKIVDSLNHFEYRSPAYNATDSNVTGLYDIYWDYDTNYSSGFEIMVNSGTAGGSYRGVADDPEVGVPSSANMTVNGNGNYYEDGGTVSNFTVIIPWDDINAMDDIYVYFAETVGTPPPIDPPPPPPPSGGDCVSSSLAPSAISANDACTNFGLGGSSIRTIHYTSDDNTFGGNNTVVYGPSSDCSTPVAVNRWYSNGTSAWYWDGTAGTLTYVGPCNSQ